MHIVLHDDGTATIRGWYFGPKLIEVIAQNQFYVVLKTLGHTDNPGSRYSGIRNYYPGEIKVFLIVSRNENVLEVEKAISWPTTRKGKKL